jgi:osmotically inducible lipoprotein OsmB
MISATWFKPAVLAVALSAALSACGTTPGDRAVSGGLLGAGTGAAIGAAAGNAGTGALIGGLGGAAIGALTSPRDVNLGKPPWRSAAYHHRHRHIASNCVTKYTDHKKIITCTR